MESKKLLYYLVIIFIGFLVSIATQGGWNGRTEEYDVFIESEEYQCYIDNEWVTVDDYKLKFWNEDEYTIEDTTYYSQGSELKCFTIKQQEYSETVMKEYIGVKQLLMFWRWHTYEWL